VIRLTIFAKSAEKLNIAWKKADLTSSGTCLFNMAGQISLKVNSNSEIVPLDVDIEVKKQSVEVIGIITDISAGSGLIKRCPECKRSLPEATARSTAESREFSISA